MQTVKEPHVLPQKMGGGPHGLGDPDDKTLRKVEIEVLIPKVMREKAKAEKCFKEVEEFSTCCKNSSFFMVFSCRKQNSAMQDCLTKWYKDEEFHNKCQDMYLNERSEFRRTGIPKKHRKDS